MGQLTVQLYLSCIILLVHHISALPFVYSLCLRFLSFWKELYTGIVLREGEGGGADLPMKVQAAGQA